jgi:hypothetical protein
MNLCLGFELQLLRNDMEERIARYFHYDLLTRGKLSGTGKKPGTVLEKIPKSSLHRRASFSASSSSIRRFKASIRASMYSYI